VIEELLEAGREFAFKLVIFSTARSISSCPAPLISHYQQ
jgi:hypothetical protein